MAERIPDEDEQDADDLRRAIELQEEEFGRDSSNERDDEELIEEFDELDDDEIVDQDFLHYYQPDLKWITMPITAGQVRRILEIEEQKSTGTPYPPAYLDHQIFLKLDPDHYIDEIADMPDEKRARMHRFLSPANIDRVEQLARKRKREEGGAWRIMWG